MSATTIPIDGAVRDRLRSFGTAGMNYSQIVTALLDRIEREEFVAEMRRLVEDPETPWTDHKNAKWD